MAGADKGSLHPFGYGVNKWLAVGAGCQRAHVALSTADHDARIGRSGAVVLC
jgi:hypothetical protein